MQADLQARRRQYFRDKRGRTLALFFVICGGVASIWLAEQRKVREDDAWPSTSGYIEQSEIALSTRSAGSSVGTVTWELRLRYRYAIGEDSYRGEQYSLEGNLQSAYREDIAEIAGRFPQGTRVSVYYDPTDPKRSVLVR